MIAFAALGSGALRYVHELAHAAEDAHRLAAHEHHDAGDEAGHEDDDEPGSSHNPHPGHEHSPLGDPADCFVHAKLNLPMLQGGYVPLLVCLGLYVAFLTSLPVPAVRSRRPSLRLNSRAPPAR